MSPVRLAGAAAVAVAVAFGSALGEPAPAAPRIIRVDLFASDARGRSVENLKPSDFEVIENAAPQAIDGLQFIKIDNRPAAAAQPAAIRSEFDEQEEAARGDTRLFAILLDEFHVSPGASTDRAREALARFVDRDLGPRDLVAVLKPLDSLLTIRVTRDRDLLRHAIAAFEGRKGDYTPRTAFERNYIAGTPARIEQVRTQVVTSALNALVIHLGKLSEGRKAVLLVSEGLARTGRRRGLEGLPTIDSVIREANRYNVSIYAFDPQDAAASDAGVPSEAAAAGRETLRTLADGTDGQAVLQTADVDAAVRRMVADSSAYYLLTYRSLQPNDGKFREVEVRVKRPGVRVRARRGYWALWPDEALAAEMLATASEPAAPAPAAAFPLPWRRSPLIRPWFALSRGDAGKTRVTFVWEAAPRVPGDRTRTGAPARLVLTAVGADGAQVFEGPVCAAGGSTCAPRAVFDVPPGKIRLRMSIEDAAARTIDSDVRELAIRDFKGPVALGTAEILRTRTAREFRALSGDPDAVPSASREFSRAEHLIVRFPVYADEGEPAVSVRLVNRVGQSLRDLPVTPPRVKGGPYEVDLILANLAPSEYSLELSATSPGGEAKDVIGFRVTN